MLRRALLIASLFLVFSVPVFRHAEAQTDVANDVSVGVTPDNPGPLEQATVTLTSYSMDLKTAEIQWTVDGKTVGGVGYTSYTLTTKAVGVPTNINVVITAAGSAPITKTVTITPMAIDLLWEATDSTVPPFYEGKAMPTSESKVKFVAIPQVVSSNGALVSADNFLYDWSLNYSGDENGSGYGKDSYSMRMDYLNPTQHVDVDIATRDGATIASNGMDLTPTTPKILWYISSPLYGPEFNEAVTSALTVKGSDTGIIAEPYFFSPGDPTSPSLQYEWSLNGADLPVPQIPNTLFLHRNSTDTGTASLDLTITNLSLLFQDATAHLDLSLQ